MQLKTKIYIGAAIAAVLAVFIGGGLLSNYKIAKLETAIAAAKQAAESSQRFATEREIEAAGYREKVEYLEARLGEIQQIARKQDEELKVFNDNSVRARGDVERARGVRSIAATADELCQKLGELGYACRP